MSNFYIVVVPLLFFYATVTHRHCTPRTDTRGLAAHHAEAYILGWGSWSLLKICRRGQSMFWPPKCRILLLKTVVGLLCKFHVIKDDKNVKNGKVKLILSRHLKQFDVSTWLILTLHILRQIYASQWHHLVRLRLIASHCSSRCSRDSN